jgi:hypothetical protein
MLQCWDKTPSERPTFAAIKEFLVGVPPAVVRALGSFTAENRLQVEPGDTIIIVDGRPELAYIKGQSQRTFDIGTFPKNLVDNQKVKAAGDIGGRPMHESFRHNTGQGSPFGACWGESFLLSFSLIDYFR